MEADVIVAGAGAAGLAAALSAAERGATVLVFDASPHFQQDSNTAMSTAMVPAAGTRWQSAAGIKDDPGRFLGDIVKKTRGTADPVVSRSLVDKAPELVEWLADVIGVPLDLATDFRYPGHSRQRMHTVPDRSGVTLHKAMMDSALADSHITFAVPFRVQRVQRSGDNWLVEVEDPQGSSEKVTTASLVLATGGFGADRERVALQLPEIADAVYFGSPFSRGDGLRIGQSVGADVAYLDAYQGHASVAIPHGILVTWATITHGAVILNDYGRRFGDEAQGYSEFAALVNAQENKRGWLVLDERIDQLCRPFADYQQLIATRAISKAEDVSAVAGVIGARVEEVEETMRAVERAVEGESDPFGRTDWERRLAPPYGVVRIGGALFHTQGGLRTDGLARVLRAGHPIPGLYACGGAAAGISGNGAAGYLGGNGLLAALGLGFLAGRTIARSRASEHPKEVT